MSLQKYTAEQVQNILRRVFGLRKLRPGQQEVIDAVLAGRDTLAILPSGAGKSLCYQLPGQARKGITVVVSPLISLMRDQTEKLEEVGLEADQVNSSLTMQEENGALARIGEARSEFVFATAERMEDPEFLALLRSVQVTLFVVDEAHCISQWGHDFRPAYLSLARAIEYLGHPTVLALTATATEEVTQDIIRQLRMRAPRVINGGVYRENLHYRVIQVTSEREKVERLLDEVRSHDGPGIVYCATVKATEAVADELAGAGESATRYHGQLPARERSRNQDAFMNGDKRIMVATNAFGMGIDKPDIRFITHFQLPGSLEAYYQETGRAGRDGKPAVCTLLHYLPDKRIQQFFLMRRFPDAADLRHVHDALFDLFKDRNNATTEQVTEQLTKKVSSVKVKVALKMLAEAGALESDVDSGWRLPHPKGKGVDYDSIARPYVEKDEHDRTALEQMIFFAQTGSCRWRVILDHFGEEPEWEHCGHCDNCTRPPEALLTPVLSPDRSPAPEQGDDTAGPPIREGLDVQTVRSGIGTVMRVEDGKATVKFIDGSTKTFLVTHLRPV